MFNQDIFDECQQIVRKDIFVEVANALDAPIKVEGFHLNNI